MLARPQKSIITEKIRRARFIFAAEWMLKCMFDPLSWLEYKKKNLTLITLGCFFIFIVFKVNLVHAVVPDSPVVVSRSCIEVEHDNSWIWVSVEAGLPTGQSNLTLDPGSSGGLKVSRVFVWLLFFDYLILFEHVLLQAPWIHIIT